MRSGFAVMAAAAGLATAVPAGAAEPERPKPPTCSGSVLTDTRGDIRNEGLDLVSAFLSVRDGKVYANLMVTRLDGVVDEPDRAEEYYFVDYTDARDRTLRVQARLNATGSREGATWFDGRDGIVQVLLPHLTIGTPTVLSVETGVSDGSQRIGGTYSIYKVQAGLDFTYDVNRDDLDKLQPQKTALCPPKPPLPEAPVGAPSETDQQAPVVTVGTPRVRGKTMRVPLRSRSRVTDLRGRLTRDGRVVARGRLAELDGRGTLVLNARRTLRAGHYVLTIPGVLEQRLKIG